MQPVLNNGHNGFNIVYIGIGEKKMYIVHKSQQLMAFILFKWMSVYIVHVYHGFLFLLDGTRYAVKCFDIESRQQCWFIVASNLNVAAWIINTLYVNV